MVKQTNKQTNNVHSPLIVTSLDIPGPCPDSLLCTYTMKT